MKIIIYQSNIIRIGGVETFTYNMCKLLSKYYDVELLYRQCHKDQLERLQKYVKCEVYDKNKTYKADLCILASSWGGYPDSVEAKEYWQMIHANYKELLKDNYKYNQWNKTTKHICVSETVKKHFIELYDTGTEVITIHNILDELQPKIKTLKLISATRLSGEKGYNRMIKLANMLKDKGIKYKWTVFTDLKQYNIKQTDLFEFKEPTYDIWEYIREADYGVQLSNTEGYSYFVNECLQYGTPMIVTNFDSVYESVEDGKNGYILDMELSNLDLDKIINHKPKFEYKPKATIDDWIKLIGKPEKKEHYDYEKIRNTKVKVQVIFPYDDIELKEHLEVGDIRDMKKYRVDELIEKKLVKIMP